MRQTVVLCVPGQFHFATGLVGAGIWPQGSPVELRSGLKCDIQASHARQVVRQRLPGQHTARLELTAHAELAQASRSHLRVGAFDSGGALLVHRHQLARVADVDGHQAASEQHWTRGRASAHERLHPRTRTRSSRRGAVRRRPDADSGSVARASRSAESWRGAHGDGTARSDRASRR